MRPSGKRKLVALVLGLALVIAFGAFLFSDPGDPSVPEGAVAIVEDAPDGEITDEEFQQNLLQAAFNLQLRELPAEDDPQFEQVEQSALSNSIQSRWVRGEAEERGITVDEREVDQAFQQIIDEQLGGQKGYEQFLRTSEVDGEPAFDEEAVRAVAELTAISDKLQTEAIPDETPDVPEEDVELFYEANAEQFETPETRDVRVVLNPDVAEIDAAIEELGTDPTPEDWDAVAEQYSTDEATKSQGGLRRDVAEGQNEPALDEAIFSAEPGEVVGPIEGESGSYVIQVEEVTEAATTPLEDVRDQIVQTLQQGISQQAITDFRDNFIAKWTARTFCRDDVLVDLCANAAPPPDPCPADDEGEREAADPAVLDQGCPAPALPRSVVNPGTGAVFPGEQLAVLPQGPAKPAGSDPAGRAAGRVAAGPGRRPAPDRRAAGAAIASTQAETQRALARLDEITRRLRRECPWDREQDERSIVPHTVEEAGELFEAAQRGDHGAMAEELGDVLFQVVFLALLLEERGEADLASVIQGLNEKLIRRHPHVFGDAHAETVADVRAIWKRVKAEERAAGRGTEKGRPS